jgi:hypothetical protein
MPRRAATAGAYWSEQAQIGDETAFKKSSMLRRITT